MKIDELVKQVRSEIQGLDDGGATLLDLYEQAITQLGETVRLSMDIIIEVQIFIGHLVETEGREFVDKSLNGPKLVEKLIEYQKWAETQKNEMGQA